MKRNLLYLFAFVCTLGFTTACDDDDDPVVDESWKELASTYDGNKLALTLNSSALFATEGRSVEFTPSSATAGVVKLNNAIPDQASVEVPVTMAKGADGYTFTSSATKAVGETAGKSTIGVEGLIATDGKLTANVTRTVQSEVTGLFKLNYVQNVGDVYVDIVTADPATNAMLGSLAPVIGGALAAKVSAVTVDLSDKGTMTPTWTKVGETTPTTLASIPTVGPMFGTLINMYYSVAGDKLMIGLDKGLLTNPAMAAISPRLQEKIGMDLQTLTSMLADVNGFLMIPLTFKQEGSLTTFYADKALVLKIANSGMLTKFIPENLAPMINGMLPLLQSAEKVNIGLRFTK